MKMLSSLLLIVLSFATFGANGAVLSTPTAHPASTLSPRQPAVTPFIAPAQRKHARREAQSSDPNPGYLCGFYYEDRWTCVDHTESCTNTLLSDTHAYLYCSTVGAPSQYYVTTAYAYTTEVSSYPDLGALYCQSTAPFVTTYLFTRDGYTATDFGCGTNSSAIEVWGADYHALNPTSFSAALASLTGGPTTTTTPPTPPGPTISHPPSPKPTDAGGMPLGEKIGIGVGVGVGVFGLGLALVAIFLVRPLFVRHRNKDLAPPRYVEPEKN